MPAGFEITNDDGILVVDENYVCLALTATGTATASGNLLADAPGGPDSCRYVDIGYSGGSFPVMALRKPQSGNRTDIGASVVGAYSDGSNWTFRVCVFGKPAIGPVDYSFEYFIYDRPRPSPANGIGVEVLNAAGEVVFSSSYKPMQMMPTTEGLPQARYGFSALASVAMQSDTLASDPDSFGNIHYDDVWSVSVTGYYSTATGVKGTTFDARGAGRWTARTPGAVESGGGSGAPLAVFKVGS